MAYIVQNNQGLSPATIVVADSIKDTMVVEGRNKLFKEENKQNSTHGCEDEVMDHEKITTARRGTYRYMS